MNNQKLERKLAFSDAVFIGLGSMIGAGVFVSAGPAASAAGSAMLVSVVVAAMLAFFNATTMAQLAIQYPESGGAYVYGRNLLGELPGFLAGWGFIVGKLASCTAMALTFAYYAYPEQPKLIAVSLVVVLSFINAMGIKKTALATKVFVALTLMTLMFFIVASLTGPSEVSRVVEQEWKWSGILSGASYLFFSFAGYARLATLGEEVKEPQRNIPKAIVTSLSLVVFLYLLIQMTLLFSVDVRSIANSKAPLLLPEGVQNHKSVIQAGAAIACVGVLISLLSGVARTAFAMARNRDLPALLSRIHSVRGVPHVAELVVSALVVVLIYFLEVQDAIAMSSFSILIYYAIANVASLKLREEVRRWPKWMSVAGFVACVAIAFSLPISVIVLGAFTYFVGSLVYVFKKT